MSVNARPAPSARRPLPSGTVTFTFTDIEGSTERWDRNRTAMQEAVRRHDTLVGATIAAYGGVVFKTIGDAFCAAFDRPDAAVGAMLATQRALTAEDFSAVGGIRMRAAIDSGTAEERDGDYFGPTLNRVARLLALGHGGQVLVSGVTSELVRDMLPAHTSLRDLGSHRLKGFARPERVYQLVAHDLASDFPSLHSSGARSNNLPEQTTSFLGRETEVREIAQLLRRHRLVTLVGTGGIGKTRASLHVARGLLERFSGGIWFIELAPLRSGDYLPTTVSQVCGLEIASEGDPIAHIVQAMEAKAALLVFDNCEHLVDPVARFVSALLRGCPQIRVLASSRQSLGNAGEATYRMPSLRLPSAAEAGTLEASEAGLYTATALFVERARAADHRFAPTDDNAPKIAEICRRLDGIPLAIELAAARVTMLSPRQICERLDERFRFLTGGKRDVLPRQQTLRALIDWSYKLLDERERTLLRRLAIFVNGFTFEGAVAVMAGESCDGASVFDALASLVDKSLVLTEAHGDSLRYRLLESTRAYAHEKCADTPDRDALARCRLRYLQNRFAELWERRERTARDYEMQDGLATEIEDVRAALDGAREPSDIVDAASLLADTGEFWQTLGLDAEVITRCEAYLAALPPGESRLIARLASVLSYVHSGRGEKARALVLATKAVTYARASGDEPVLGNALHRFAIAATLLNQLEHATRALADAEAMPGVTANLRISLMTAHALYGRFSGDLKSAARSFERLREENRALGNVFEELGAAQTLAEIEHAAGRTEQAIEIIRETLPLARSGAAKRRVANSLINLAGYLLALDDIDGASAAAREGIVLNAERADDAHIAVAIEHLALAFALRGDLRRAATLGAYADAAFARNGFEREATERMTCDRLATLLRKLSPGERALRASEGTCLTQATAIACALGD